MVEKFIRSFAGTIDKINLRIGEIAKFLLPLVGLVLIFEVFSRYVFGKPTLWAHEASQHLFGFAIMLGGAYAYYYGSHVNVDVLVRRLSPRKRAVVDCFVFLLILLYFGTMFLKSIPMVVSSWQRMDLCCQPGGMEDPAG